MDNKEFDRLSYALGLSMGHNFRAMGMENSAYRISPTALLLSSTAKLPK